MNLPVVQRGFTRESAERRSAVFKDPGRHLRQEKGWVRRACKPPLHHRKIHQNYSQTSLKVSSFNLKILMNPPVVQGIHMRVLKLSNADRKEEKRGKYCPLLPSTYACNGGIVPCLCPSPEFGRDVW